MFLILVYVKFGFLFDASVTFGLLIVVYVKLVSLGQISFLFSSLLLILN